MIAQMPKAIYTLVAYARETSSDHNTIFVGRNQRTIRHIAVRDILLQGRRKNKELKKHMKSKGGFPFETPDVRAISV